MKAIELLNECRLNMLNREHHERLLNDDDRQLIRKLDEFIADFRVDVPPVDCGDPTPECDRIRHQLGYSVCPKCAAPNVPAEITNRMLAGWGRYNYMACADKGSHDMRLAFIAGYKRALEEAANKVMMICNANDYLACRAVLNEAATAIRSLKQSNSGRAESSEGVK